MIPAEERTFGRNLLANLLLDLLDYVVVRDDVLAMKHIIGEVADD